MKQGNKRRTKRHQNVYYMVGCSCNLCKSTRSRKHNKPRKQKGGCGEMCAAPHSMIGGYLRGTKNKTAKRQKRGTKSSGSRSSDSTSLRGGGPLWQDLMNSGRSVIYDVGSVYNASYGEPLPVDPSPYKNQYSKHL